MNLRSSGFRRALAAAVVIGAAAVMVASTAIGGSSARQNGDDPSTIPVTARPLTHGETAEEGSRVLLERDAYFTSLRTAGDIQLDVVKAGQLHANAARGTIVAKRNRPRAVTKNGPVTFNGAWTEVGPNPISQFTRSSFSRINMSGRIGSLLIRSDGTMLLGAAQGGIWMWDDGAGQWIPKSENVPSLAIGDLAAAPSDDSIVYAGTGEGALSGDSMFGNGILKSTDGGDTWTHVSGDYFEGVSTSRLVVDPTNPNHLYAAILRGRGGARRVTPPVHSQYGIWESNDGAVTWNLLK